MNETSQFGKQACPARGEEAGETVSPPAHPCHAPKLSICCTYRVRAQFLQWPPGRLKTSFFLKCRCAFPYKSEYFSGLHIAHTHLFLMKLCIYVKKRGRDGTGASHFSSLFPIIVGSKKTHRQQPSHYVIPSRTQSSRRDIQKDSFSKTRSENSRAGGKQKKTENWIHGESQKLCQIEASAPFHPTPPHRF